MLRIFGQESALLTVLCITRACGRDPLPKIYRLGEGQQRRFVVCCAVMLRRLGGGMIWYIDND